VFFPQLSIRSTSFLLGSADSSTVHIGKVERYKHLAAWEI
jgi:hypothetical protein